MKPAEAARLVKPGDCVAIPIGSITPNLCAAIHARGDELHDVDILACAPFVDPPGPPRGTPPAGREELTRDDEDPSPKLGRVFAKAAGERPLCGVWHSTADGRAGGSFAREFASAANPAPRHQRERAGPPGRPQQERQHPNPGYEHGHLEQQ